MGGVGYDTLFSILFFFVWTKRPFLCEQKYQTTIGNILNAREQKLIGVGIYIWYINSHNTRKKCLKEFTSVYTIYFSQEY